MFPIKAVLTSVPVLMTFGVTAVVGQAPAPTPAAAFSKARALYYTPADRGLEGFQCEVNFNWKEFIQKATNQPVPDDDARLKYLQTIQLSVDDELRATGELHWTAPTPAPAETEDSIGKMRGGMQQMWSGFFQSWNGFFTGDMVTLDAKSTIEHTSTGYHLATRSGAQVAEEQYDEKFLLQSLHVTTPALESTVTPGFRQSPEGLLVTSIRSVYQQPPTAPATEVLMTINYATVGTFQLPSELAVSVGPANFDFHLTNCTVKTALTKK